MLTTTVNFPTRRAPSPQIRARDTSLNGASNSSAGVNSAPDLGGQRCGDHEDRGDSTNYRKLAEHKIVPQPGAIATTVAATNKCLAQSNKSAAGGKVTKKLGGEARPSKASYCQPDKLSTA